MVLHIVAAFPTAVFPRALTLMSVRIYSSAKKAAWVGISRILAAEGGTIDRIVRAVEV